MEAEPLSFHHHRVMVFRQVYVRSVKQWTMFRSSTGNVNTGPCKMDVGITGGRDTMCTMLKPKPHAFAGP